VTSRFADVAAFCSRGGLQPRARKGEGGAMRHNWEPEDLVASWTLLDADRELVANKAGATRLGFALLLSS
jgi:hypothetical protein